MKDIDYDQYNDMIQENFTSCILKQYDKFYMTIFIQSCLCPIIYDDVLCETMGYCIKCI